MKCKKFDLMSPPPFEELTAEADEAPIQESAEGSKPGSGSKYQASDSRSSDPQDEQDGTALSSD